MAYTFDGATKRITLSANTVSLDLVDLYSRWKDWVKSGHAECLLAFSTVGGDITEIPLYLFMLNGWLIVPQSANHTLTVIGGVLVGQSGADPFNDPAGSYKIRINRQVPGIAIGYNTSGGTGPSAADIAVAVIAAAQASPIWADARAISGLPIIGNGQPGDEFGV
jgi:hypothetical protein